MRYAGTPVASNLPAVPATGRCGALLAALLALGLGLRILGAQGDLWLDEVWTLVLLRPITSIGGIFWGINHDNNHILNSLYLYLVGLDAAPLVLRTWSIALGTVSVIVAWAIGLRVSLAGAVLAALVVATAYPMVHYGSEARGYAGLILCVLLASYLVEQGAEHPLSWRPFALGLVVVTGVFFHAFMLGGVAMLGLWAAYAQLARTRSISAAFRPLLALFWFAAICVLVLAELFLRLVSGTSFIVGVIPFVLGDFLAGYGAMVGFAFGLPPATPPLLALAIASGIVAMHAILRRHAQDRRTSLYLVFVLALPALMAAGQVPNTHFPRYFLISATMLLLCFSEVTAELWRRGGKARISGVLMLATFLIGTATALVRFNAEGRGHYANAVAAIAADGERAIGGNHDLRVPMLLNYYAGRAGVPVAYVPRADLCRDKPRRFVVEDGRGTTEEMLRAVAPCPPTLTPIGTFHAWGLSGATWVLYDASWD